jgi:hypothetical protein
MAEPSCSTLVRLEELGMPPIIMQLMNEIMENNCLKFDCFGKRVIRWQRP